MASFSYVAYEDSGRKLTGFVDAADSDAAIATMAARGVHVLDIKEQAGQSTPSVARKAKVSRSDLALYTRRLADLASAGLPLDRALQVAGEQSENATLTSVTEEAIRDVRAGIPISEALAKYPKLFPTVFTMTLRAGEASGQFPEVAGRLAEFQQMEVRRRSQLAAAMVYPCILFCSAIVVVAFLILFIVPRLSDVFRDLGNDLPLTTKWLLGFSNFMVHNGLWVLAGIVAAFYSYRAWSSTEQGSLARDKWLLNAPMVGKVVSKSVVSRYARVLGTLVYGGVPILEALRIAGAASGNRVFEANTQRVQNEVREGRRIAEAMKDTGAFSSILVQMVSVGEETGDLPRMLGRVSETLDFEVDNGMQKLTAIVEPAIVLTMGVFVGFVVLSILLPVYQAQGLVK